jgi:hypothetical protein
VGSKIQWGPHSVRRSFVLFLLALVASLIGACSPAESLSSSGSAPPEAHERVASEEREGQQEPAGITRPGTRERAVTSEHPEVREEPGANRVQDAAPDAATDGNGHAPTEGNVYSETTTEELDASVAAVPERVYVPNVGTAPWSS